MPHTKKDLESGLSSLGIRPGDSLLLHSSFRSLGGVEGGAEGFFDVLLGLLGENGTLVLPALSYESVTEESPYFDVRTTPSCVGYLSEYFRTQVLGVRRSLHATHSCCVRGRLRDEMIKGHELDATPVGAHSPFSRLPQAGGKILFLGCSPDRNTSMHGVEETVSPMRFIDFSKAVDYRITDEAGRAFTRPSFRHSFYRADGSYGQRYGRILGLLDEREKALGRVLDADCVLMDARAVWEKGHAMMEKDPFYFVEWMKIP